MTATTRLSQRRPRDPDRPACDGAERRLMPASGTGALAVLAMATALVLSPFLLTDHQLNVLAFAGVAAIGALSLNLLIGYTGQVSLGHGFFVAVGSYAVAYLGSELGLPLVAWLPLCALIGAALGAAVGPCALRLRGDYLVVVSIGLLFVGQYVFENWESFTGAGLGRSTAGALPLLDSNRFELLQFEFTRNQGYFWLIWLSVGVVVLLVRNLIQSRTGRAMQAVRDSELAAEAAGVNVVRTKIMAFALAGALAAVAGALHACLFRSAQWVDPPLSMLNVSIQYVAIVIVGGIGTVHGPVLGALVIGSLPQVIQSVTLDRNLPFVAGDRGGPDGFIEVASLNNLIYGLIIVVFLMFEPHGVAATIRRVRARLLALPFVA